MVAPLLPPSPLPITSSYCITSSYYIFLIHLPITFFLGGLGGGAPREYRGGAGRPPPTAKRIPGGFGRRSPPRRAEDYILSKTYRTQRRPVVSTRDTF